MVLFHLLTVPAGESCTQLLTAFHLRRVNVAVFPQSGQLQPWEGSQCSHLSSPSLSAVEFLGTASQALQEMSFSWRVDTVILSLFGSCLHLPLPALGRCLLTQFNPCWNHRRACSVFGRDDWALTLTFPVLLPCWPLFCLSYLSGCYLQFLEMYWA